MKELYEIFDNIRPAEDSRARIKANIERRIAIDNRTANRPRFYLKAAAAIAALMCLVTVSVFAKDIAGHLGLFERNDIVADSVKSDVFYFSDSNVELTVEELISDGVTAKAVLHYHALTDRGAEWLNTFDGHIQNSIVKMLRIKPNIKDNNTVLYGVNYSCESMELTEYATTEDRYFYVCMNASSDKYATMQVVLTYAMSDGTLQDAVIDITTSIERREYIFPDDFGADNEFIPTRMVYSPLSIVIYGRVGSDSDYQLDYGDICCKYDGVYYDMCGLVKYRYIYDPFPLDIASVHSFTGYSVNGSSEEIPIYTVSFIEPIDLELLESIMIYRRTFLLP